MNSSTLTSWLLCRKAAGFSPILSAAEVIPSNAGVPEINIFEGRTQSQGQCNYGTIGCADNPLIGAGNFSSSAQQLLQAAGGRLFRFKAAEVGAHVQNAHELSNELAYPGGAVRSSRSDLLRLQFA